MTPSALAALGAGLRPRRNRRPKVSQEITRIERYTPCERLGTANQDVSSLDGPIDLNPFPVPFRYDFWLSMMKSRIEKHCSSKSVNYSIE